MANAPDPQRAQDTRLGIALHGVKNIAWKALDEPPRRAGDRRRAQAQQWIARPHPGDHIINRGKSTTPLRAGSEETALRRRTILRTQEATHRSARGGARGGMTDRGESRRRGGSAPGASDDGARTSHRVPEHIRFP